jgi:sRNA-binding carbon storage regulator CsrA
MRKGQRVQIGEHITLSVIQSGARGGNIKVGIEAPETMEIKRIKKEQYEEKRNQTED